MDYFLSSDYANIANMPLNFELENINIIKVQNVKQKRVLKILQYAIFPNINLNKMNLICDKFIGFLYLFFFNHFHFIIMFSNIFVILLEN